MADEQIKEPMIIWAQNISYQIPLSNWNILWKTVKSFKLVSNKENIRFYRWYMSPKLVKIYKGSMIYAGNVIKKGTFSYVVDL